jgi:type IV fimbrial biogenesis protein FimT
MAINRRDDRGFTLVELMIVVVIVGVMLTLGVPGLRDLLVKNRMTSKLNEFVGAIQTARSEAIKNNAIVRICPSANGTSCSSGGGAGWHQGWIVYIDFNGNNAVNGIVAGPPAFPADEIIVRANAPDGFSFKAGLASASSIGFSPNGTALSGASQLTCATANACMLRFCIGDEAEGELSLEPMGRPSRPNAKRLDSVTGCP